MYPLPRRLVSTVRSVFGASERRFENSAITSFDEHSPSSQTTSMTSVSSRDRSEVGPSILRLAIMTAAPRKVVSRRALQIQFSTTFAKSIDVSRSVDQSHSPQTEADAPSQVVPVEDPVVRDEANADEPPGT